MEQENIERWVEQISKEFSLNRKNVMSVTTLLQEGSTVPFISRYRKEMTGSMDEVMIAKIRDRMEQLQELDVRREAIISSVEKQGKLSLELMQAIVSAETIAPAWKTSICRLSPSAKHVQALPGKKAWNLLLKLFSIRSQLTSRKLLPLLLIQKKELVIRTRHFREHEILLLNG